MVRITRAERLEIERKLHEPKWRVRQQRVQTIVQGELEKFRDQSEVLLIRTVVPRTEIKDLPSVIAKIKRNRAQQNPHYSLSDVEDLIGVKILCPYPSDVQVVIACMRNHQGFRVIPESNEEARRDRENGYRGFHFAAHLQGPLLIHNEDLMGITCEVQVKTMLEEAWDAKTHDVTYRREEQVNPELLRQMKLVSDELAVLGERTEHLKDLILERQRQERQRKEVVVAVYLHESMPQVQKIISGIPEAVELLEGKFTATNVLGLVPVIQRHREKGELSRVLCRLAALVGLYARGRHMDVWATDVCDELIRQKPNDPRACLTKASVCWALDNLDDAIEEIEICMQKAEEQGEEDTLAEAKGSFAYMIGEKAWSGQELDPVLVERAKAYVDDAIEMRPGELSQNYDTKGFLLIATGSTKEEIEAGKKLILQARETALGTSVDKTSRAFYERHETMALIKLSAIESKKATH